jgi:hypothetical protein
MNPVLGEKIPISRSVIVSDDESCVRVGCCCEYATVELFSCEYIREKERGSHAVLLMSPGVGMIWQND